MKSILKINHLVYLRNKVDLIIYYTLIICDVNLLNLYLLWQGKIHLYAFYTLVKPLNQILKNCRLQLHIHTVIRNKIKYIKISITHIDNKN